MTQSFISTTGTAYPTASGTIVNAPGGAAAIQGGTIIATSTLVTNGITSASETMLYPPGDPALTTLVSNGNLTVLLP